MSESQENHNELEELAAHYEKRIYDLQQFLEIAQSLCSTLDFSNLIQSILFTSMSQVHVTSAGIFVLDALDSDTFRLYTNSEIRPKKYTSGEFGSLIQIFNSDKKIFHVEDIVSSVPDASRLDEFASLNPSLIVPMKQRNQLNGILVLGERIDLGEGLDYTEYEKAQMVTLASLSAVAIANSILVERSSTDMMTHLKLKYYFFNILSEKMNEPVVPEKSLAVIMFDIDFFKKFNDTYGHECGDYVLKTIAHIIKSGVREQDLASRYGGEEFVVLLCEITKDDALVIAERLREDIENYRFDYKGKELKVTISGGISIYDGIDNAGITPKQLVEQADRALYVSKGNGRNRITFADEEIRKAE